MTSGVFLWICLFPNFVVHELPKLNGSEITCPLKTPILVHVATKVYVFKQYVISTVPSSPLYK